MAVFEAPDFAHLPAPLAAFFARAAAHSFFAQPLWYHVLSRYGTDKGGAVRLYLDDAEAPRAGLVCRTAAAGARRLDGLSTYYSCEYGPLAARDDPALSARVAALAGAIAGERPRWGVIRLAGLDPADPGYDALRAGFRQAGCAVFPYVDSATWYEATAGLDFRRYVETRPASLRNTWRRKDRKLAAAGRMQLVFHEDATALDEGIADYETVYRASWKGSEPFPDFTPELLRAAAALGALRLGILRIDGRAAAAQLWLLWQGRATIYKLAHDQAFDDLSLGTILTMRLMERVLDRDKPDEIDFGRGDDPYKQLWLKDRRERRGLLIANPRTAAGAVVAARESAAAAVKRWRR